MSTLTDEELGLGGFRFEDLQERRIVENRTDLLRKQTDLGFPKPIKTGASQAMFLKSEVYAWLRMRAALRDVPLPPPERIITPLSTGPLKKTMQDSSARRPKPTDAPRRTKQSA